MYAQLNEDALLGAEAAVSLDIDDFGPEPGEWEIDRHDLLEAAEREAWSRHATRAAGFATAAAEDDYGSSALTEAVRRVMDMSWD